jgi:hypothetical protein
MHQQVGNGSLHGYFSNPANEVSAHFWIAKSGAVEQYVDTSVVAWHAKHLNVTYCGAECEGYPDEALTDAQCLAFSEVMAEGAQRHGWALRLAESAGQPGLGYHRMPGGVNTACPSQLRVDQRALILELAQTGGQAPTLKRKGRTMIAATDTGEGYWTTTHDGAVYAFGDAQFRGSAFDVDPITPGAQPVHVSGEVVGIAGCRNDGYWLLASDGGVFTFGSAQFYGRPDRV